MSPDTLTHTHTHTHTHTQKRKTVTKDLGMETQPREGVVKEKKFPHSMKPSHRLVYGEFWSLRGQHNQERKKRKPTEYTPNFKYKQRRRSGPDAHIKYQ